MEEKKKKEFHLSKLKKENFVVIFLIGMLLLIIAWPVENKKSEKEGSVSGITDSGSGIMGVQKKSEEKTLMQMEITGNEDTQAYLNALESSLEALLSTMDGAGKVRVMITLEASGEAVIEKDILSSKNSSTEVDSAGGSRNAADVSKEEETVYTDSGSGVKAPFVRQVIYPRIEGVVVSAQGGDNAAVNKNITEAIQALFGIDVHKIKVIKMSSR